MQFSLREFAAEVARGTVRMGEVEVDVRALSAAELRIVQGARPRPSPPKKRPPGKGLEAPFEPDATDGKFRQELDAWHFFVQVGAAAIGLGHRLGAGPGGAWPAAGTPAEQTAWLEAAYAELAGALSDQELGAIFSAIDALGMARLVGKAAGGSLAPLPSPAPTMQTASLPLDTASPPSGLP